eukprot:TRINITY_DN37659_c0_g1_i1.p1 TRINITY_DN37659_c0_g1~~TRINITY_DN37659_c0_g1_i1.p1  ORF type:complete len:293 (+),score=76.20 TRINITY_DN37659_c0_g1_i1:44-880(+)
MALVVVGCRASARSAQHLSAAPALASVLLRVPPRRHPATLPLLPGAARQFCAADAAGGARGGAAPSRTVQTTPADVMRAIMSPSRVHDVFNPRLGVAEGTPPSWISDVGQVLSPEERSELDSLSAAINDAWRMEVTVVLLDSLPEDVQPSAFSAALLNYWGVGDPQLHTGLLIMLLRKQRRLEMRVGYGAGRALPPDVLQDVQQRCMVPHLRAEAAGAALLDGLRGISEALEAKGPPHWRRAASASPPAANRHGFGGGQTPVDEFMPEEERSRRNPGQ